MPKIIKQLNEETRNLKLIGKKYVMNGNAGFSDKWELWFTNNMFEPLENANTNKDTNSDYIGFMRWINNIPNSFEYWIGMFVNKDDVVPTGYEEIEVPDTNVLTFYVKGFDGPELYNYCNECFKQATMQNYQIYYDTNNYCYMFERYNCPRFTNPDENGEVILDLCLLVK